MELDNLKKSIQEYKQQLAQVETALISLGDNNDENRAELIDLKDQLQQLIDLTQDSLNEVNENSNEDTNNGLDAEFALFMSEMEKDGVVKNKSGNSNSAIADDLKNLEGMKCRAPHVHQWGDTMYHNALVCSVIPTDEDQNFEEIMVKVMFINPTHEEMLPCPYLMEGSCKFDDDKCKFSHGKIVSFSSLQEYVQPNFESVRIESKVLAKQKNKLWGRATIKRIRGEKYFVKFDSNREEVRLELHDVLPLGSDGEDNDDDENLSSDSDPDKEDIINMSLMTTPASQALGDWEKHTKGFGSKMMQKMGYVVGTGLGRFSDGRIEPVPAVCLPPGRSLDHCMHLKEKAGGDKDLFSVEKKLKRLQKKQEQRNTKAYEKGKQEVDVFNFINHTISKPKQENPGTSKCKHRQEIKKESVRSLNIASLQIEEDIKKIERDLYKIRESLTRHSDSNSQVHKSLKQKLTIKLNEIQRLKDKAGNISNEQNVRNYKKKITVF